MSNFFRPGDPKFRRAMQLISIYSCSAVTANILMFDFGSHEHVLTPVQRYLNAKVDLYYRITPDELYNDVEAHKVDKKTPMFQLKRVDRKNSSDSSAAGAT